MLLLSPVIARLQERVPALRLVAGAADFAAIRGAIATHPAAWVLPLGDTPGENSLAAGGLMQAMEATFGVVLAVRDVSDARGEAGADAVVAIRRDVHAALLGWSPDADAAPIEYGQGRLVAFADGFVWWQEEFVTTYYLRALAAA